MDENDKKFPFTIEPGITIEPRRIFSVSKTMKSGQVEKKTYLVINGGIIFNAECTAPRKFAHVTTLPKKKDFTLLEFTKDKNGKTRVEEYNESDKIEIEMKLMSISSGDFVYTNE